MFGSTNRSSGFGQMPAFGGVGSTPTQTNPFGSSTQPSQPAFGSSIFGSSTPFGASSQPTFGSIEAPSFGATSTPVFGATSTPAFGATSTSAFDPQEAETMYQIDLFVKKWLEDRELSNTFSESYIDFMEEELELRGKPFNYSVVSCPAVTEDDGSTSGQTAKLESISAMPAYKYKRFESCVAIAGADYCVIAADYTRYHHTKILQVTEKSVMASSGLPAHVNALQEALLNLIDKHQHNKPMSCAKIDRLLSDVLFSKSVYHSYTVLVGFDSKGKGRVFTHTNGYAMYERAGYISQKEFIMPPILEYKLPAEVKLPETEAVDLVKTIFASTTCTGDKLEIVVLNASGLRREYMDLRKH